MVFPEGGGGLSESEKWRTSWLELPLYAKNKSKDALLPLHAVVLFEFEVIPDLSPVDFIEHLEVLTGFAQSLEALAALRTSECMFGSILTFHKVDGRKSLDENGNGIWAFTILGFHDVPFQFILRV
jgi:hypothetical protein